MLDEFKEEEIVKRVGGRFKLSSLMQKRLVALKRGARPLVDPSSKTDMEIVVQEIMEDKIFLDTAGAMVTAEEGVSADGPVTEDAGPTLDDL